MLTIEGLGAVTGWSGDPSYFEMREYDSFQPEAALDVLDGRVAGVMFRGMADPAACAEIVQRFWDSPHRCKRGVEAPGYYIGAYTWNKPVEQYLDESAAVTPILEELLDVRGNPMAEFYKGLSAALAARGAIIRPAEHNGRRSCPALLRSWHGAGDFALEPHDDDSQCLDPLMAGYERERVMVHQVVALNICLEQGSAGGSLVYWNVRPDTETKRRLGIEFTGSPYPASSLMDSEVMTVEVNVGDVYLFNGAHPHAVEPNARPEDTRTTVASMMGFIGDRTVVTWT